MFHPNSESAALEAEQRVATPAVKHRSAYRPPTHWIERTDLEFELGERTIVRARLQVRRNGPDVPLALDGEGLETLRVAVDGRALEPQEYELTDGKLTLAGLPERCVVETKVAIRPFENTAVAGLYVSSGNFCTQGEAKGVRRITGYLDRPDVMSRYSTTITADPVKYPVLLSNGNRVAEEKLDDGRTRVRWEDPFPKPSYLFALVGGDLRKHAGTFTTCSGREVALEIWVEPRNVDACEHALVSLKKAMAWDEERFGREYDLDIYMIVAVGDFNMGAMENKGLNVFNSKFVLARPETATDTDYERIEGVIAHEYFHNWTGNRVTCRDWFQLTLKEGLTVYRDQFFSADMSSHAVKRIEDVKALRIAQFAEDSGPMAHPIRPESYIEMNNFYTVTVYEKGAEVVRLYSTLLGEEGFRKGMDLYFERHDGSAVTCDDFRAAMADANDVDLDQFERWYSQAGTPELRVRARWDAAMKTYALEFEQSLPEVAGATSAPLPMHIPIAVGLLGADGKDLPLRIEGARLRDGGRTAILELRDAKATFTFHDVAERPIPSVLREFSAPVKLVMERGLDELAFLMAHDSDSFNRWDAGETLASKILLALADDAKAGRPLKLDERFAKAWGAVLADPTLDGSLKALALTLPAERQLGQAQKTIHPTALHEARSFAARELARIHRDALTRLYADHAPRHPYSNDRDAIDRRSLANCALSYLSRLETSESTALVARHYREADNMTDSMAALAILASMDVPERDEALADFHGRWRQDPLVLDKWFTVQAVSTLAETPARVAALRSHPDFTLKNPNRARSLIGAFALANQVRFHDPSGAGYRFLADAVIELDAINPQVASRMVSGFNPWKRYGEARRELMRKELERIAAKPKLSRDVYEIVSKALA